MNKIEATVAYIIIGCCLNVLFRKYCPPRSTEQDLATSVTVAVYWPLLLGSALMFIMLSYVSNILFKLLKPKT